MTDIPDLDAITAKRVRRATWRGIARTAVVVVVALVLLDYGSGIASKGWQNRGSHDTRFFDIVSPALVARHPGWVIEGSLCCVPGHRFDLRFEVGLRPPGLGRRERQTNVTVRQNWRGHVVDVTGDPNDFGDFTTDLFLRQDRTVDETRALAASLPAASTLLVVVVYDRPLSLNDPALTTGFEPLTYYLESPVREVDDFLSTNPLAFSWPATTIDELKPWARRLQSHDERNLFGFRVDQIQAIARRPRVYATIYDDISPAQFDALLSTGRVTRATVVDAALQVDPAALR